MSPLMAWIRYHVRMEFEFEVFQKGLRMLKGPKVTIQRAGNIGLNEASFVALGEPAALELMYDRKRRVIGFRKAPEDSLYGCATRPSGPGRAKSAVVSAKTFLMHYEIPFDAPLRYAAEMVDDILIVDLKKPAEDAISNRTRGKQLRQQQASSEDLENLRDELQNGSGDSTGVLTKRPDSS